MKKYKINWMSLTDDQYGGREGLYTLDEAQRICESMNRAYKGKRTWSYEEVES